MVRQANKCVICEERPVRKGGFCAQCYSHIEHERKARAPIQPLHFLTYKGYVIGLYPNGGGDLKARLETRSADHLPKRRTIDLNVWCEGYSRDQIREFKRCVLALANA